MVKKFSEFWKLLVSGSLFLFVTHFRCNIKFGQNVKNSQKKKNDKRNIRKVQKFTLWIS